MPLDDWQALRTRLPAHRFAGDHGIRRRLRMVKSTSEGARIRAACAVPARAFARPPEIARPGTALSEGSRHVQILCLEAGANWVPYLAGGAGPGGHADVIPPADDREIAAADVLTLDAGLDRPVRPAQCAPPPPRRGAAGGHVKDRRLWAGCRDHPLASRPRDGAAAAGRRERGTRPARRRTRPPGGGSGWVADRACRVHHHAVRPLSRAPAASAAPPRSRS